MFGEDTIYGQKQVKKDGKNRIVLPSFTYAEKGDSLLILKVENLFEIYSENTVNKVIEEYEEKLSKANREKERIYYEKELLRIFSMILRKTKCDGNNRILASGIYDEDPGVKIIGAKNHVKILHINE